MEPTNIKIGTLIGPRKSSNLLINKTSENPTDVLSEVLGLVAVFIEIQQLNVRDNTALNVSSFLY
jgi:hypothetical protein